MNSIRTESTGPWAHEAEGLMVHLLDIDLMKGGCEWRMEQRFTESYVLIVATLGQGRLSVGSQHYRLRQDAVYVCPPGETFGAAAESEDGLGLFLLRYELYRIAGSNLDAVRCSGGAGFFPERGEIPVPSGARLAALCHTAYLHRQSRDSLERFRGQLVFQELLYSILENRRHSAEDSHSALERAKAYMDSHYQQNLSIEQLARLADISPKYFVDLFKKLYGISAVDYLTALRMNKAKQLMARSNARLKDIAHQVGYNDEFYFSRKFKKETGCPPTTYMSKRRRKIAAYGAGVTGHLLALHMIPYAAPLNPKWTAYYYRTYRSDIPVHLSAYRHNEHWKSNIETLFQVRPDSIISTDELQDGEKEMLEQAAPVYYIPRKHTDWREQLRLTAEYLDIPKEAELWLNNYDRKVKAVRERLKHKTKNETFLTLSLYKDRCQVYANRSIIEVFYGDLQLTPAHAIDQVFTGEPVTPERLHVYDADHILVNVCQETESLLHWESLQLSPSWQSLKAVSRNQVYVISSDPWREYSASSHDRLVDGTLRLLTGNRPC